MTAYTIDTLTTAQNLKQAGFKTEQAEAVAKAIAHQSGELATKADIAGLRWMLGLHFAFTLVMLGFLFAIWRDVATLTAGG